MKQLGTGVFEVGSETSNRTYIVNMNPDPPTCTCTAFAIARNRGNPTCKHLRQVQDTGAIDAVADLQAVLAEMREKK